MDSSRKKSDRPSTRWESVEVKPGLHNEPALSWQPRIGSGEDLWFFISGSTSVGPFPSLRGKMGDHSLFLSKFLRHGTKIASFAPSSRWLSRATVGNVDWARAEVIVELGAGTGPITRAIADRVRPETRVIVLERDADFAAILRERFSSLANFEVIEGDARDLATMLGDRGIGRVDHVISGLPVPSFPKDLQHDLFRVVREVLAPEGTYNQITEIAWYYQGLYRKFFNEVRFVFEPRNFPPAGAYYCRSPKEIS